MICWGTKRRKAILGDTSKEMKKELNTFTHSFNMYCVPTLRQAREKKKKVPWLMEIVEDKDIWWWWRSYGYMLIPKDRTEE